jgi:HK97 family phage prohead protease
MTTQTKTYTPFEVKATDDGSRSFEGLASTWDLDLGGDVIHRGAFRRTLDHWTGSKKRLPLLDQHNYGSVRSIVGGLKSAKETDDGLVTEFEVLDGPDGDEVYRRIKGGFVDGLSIGYEPVAFDFDENDAGERVRHLREVKLLEVSVVLWPMNPGARIQNVKSVLGGFKDRDLTEADVKELRSMSDEITALLEASAPGLAPDDPARIEMDEILRDIALRTLATR